MAARSGSEMTDIEARLRSRGLRLTAQRLAVAQTVLDAPGCVTAAQVHVSARGSCPDLGLMTVYRTLEILSVLGVIRRVHGGDRCEAFVAAREGHGHTVVCTACGRVSEFTHCHLDDVAAAAARETGFAIGDHVLQFSGVCASCRQTVGTSPPERAGATGVARGRGR
jgi:Fur family transcriptional regulator, ferric uptake regulator